MFKFIRIFTNLWKNIRIYIRLSKNLRINIRIYPYWGNWTNTNTINIRGPFYSNIGIFEYSNIRAHHWNKQALLFRIPSFARLGLAVHRSPASRFPSQIPQSQFHCAPMSDPIMEVGKAHMKGHTFCCCQINYFPPFSWAKVRLLKSEKKNVLKRVQPGYLEAQCCWPELSKQIT